MLNLIKQVYFEYFDYVMKRISRSFSDLIFLLVVEKKVEEHRVETMKQKQLNPTPTDFEEQTNFTMRANVKKVQEKKRKG